MPSTWIVTANASKAHIYSFSSFKTPLALVKNFEHPEARKKEHDLIADKSGHYTKQNQTPNAYETTSEKEIEADQFAREITGFLEKNSYSQKFSKLILAASPHFLGQLKKHFNNALSKLTKLAIPKDYTCVTENELISILHDEHRKKLFSVTE